MLLLCPSTLAMHRMYPIQMKLLTSYSMQQREGNDLETIERIVNYLFSFY